jgi:hypothetical protein
MSRNPAEVLPPHDLDATDRLPVLDPTALAEDDPYSTTGTWSAPDVAAVAANQGPDTLSQLIGERENEIAELTGSLREKSLAVGLLERELEQVRSKLAGLRQESDQQLRAAATHTLELDQARNVLAAELEARRAAVTDLEQRLAEAEKGTADLLAAVASARAERERATAALAQSRAEQERLAGRLASTEEERDQVAREAVNAASERDHLAGEIASAMAERDRLVTEAAALAERLSAAERVAAQSRDERATTVLRERDDARRRARELETTLTAAQADLAEARAALRQRERALQQALEGRQTAEARQRYVSDFRHATPSRRLQRELASANEQIQALAARLADMEAAQAGLRAASESSLRELYAKLRETEQARDSAEQRASELAVRASDAEATLAAVDAGEDFIAGADEPTIAQEDRDTLARKIEELSGEVARRDDRIVTLEAELRAQSEALDTIRRSLGVLGTGRGAGDDARPDATLSRRYLVPLDGEDRHVCILDRQRITVGRTPENSMAVREPYISRLHAVLRLGPEVTVVEDAGSTNGVFVNDHRVQRQLLHDGDVVAFGKARFRFQLQPPATEA